jgi:hypothetical protein
LIFSLRRAVIGRRWLTEPLIVQEDPVRGMFAGRHHLVIFVMEGERFVSAALQVLTF